MATVSTTASKTRRPDAVTLAVLGGACLFLFAVLAVALWHVRGPVGIDDALGSAKTRGAAGVYLGLVADFGSPWFVGLAALMLAVVAHAAGDRLAVAVCVVGPVLAGVCELVAKPAVDRLKESALSYPSGHAIGAAAVAALVVLVSWRLGGRDTALLVAGPAAAIPLAVSVAVVRLGWHYPTDTIGGIALGVGVVCATAAALDKSPKTGRTS